MKMALINGSPKVKGSASGILLEKLKQEIAGRAEEAEIVEIVLRSPVIPKDAVMELEQAGLWVFAFPLYADGVPAHLLSCLEQLEQMSWQKRDKYIYGIVNCGFYEGIQAEPALKILQNWCAKAGFRWFGGSGVGGGGSLAMVMSIPRGKGPTVSIYRMLGEMAGLLLQGEEMKNQYVTVDMPRFLYKMAGQMGWRQMIRANGGRVKDLGRRP